MGIGVNVVLVVDIDICAAVDRDDRKHLVLMMDMIWVLLMDPLVV